MFRGLKLSLYFSRQQSVLKSRRQCLLVVYRKCLVGTTCSLFHNAVLHSTHTKNRHLLFRIHDGWGRSRWHDKTNTLPENQSWSWKQTDSLRQWCCLLLCYPFLCVSACVCVCVCVCLSFWRANGRISQSYLPRELTDELTGLDALFINKDQLRLQRGQHLEPTHTHTHSHTLQCSLSLN